MPRRRRRQARGSMYWWNNQLATLRRECLAGRRRFTRSKADLLLHEAWKRANAALRRGIKKSRLQCWKDFFGEVKKDPWGLAFKIVTKKMVTRRKTPGLDNHDQVQYIVRNLFPHVEPFQRQDRSSCVVRREEGQQTSRGSLIVQTNMSIRYDGEASGGVDSTTASDPSGRGERSLGEPVRFQERQVNVGCHLSCGQHRHKCKKGNW